MPRYMGDDSQHAKILNHLKAGGTITPMQALPQFGCFRLAARIRDLRRDGHDIRTFMRDTATGKRVAEYFMVRT